MPEGTSVNGTVYLNVSKEKLSIFMKSIAAPISNMMDLPATKQKQLRNGLTTMVFRSLYLGLEIL